MTERKKVLCQACKTENDSEERNCQHCGLPLSSAAAESDEWKQNRLLQPDRMRDAGVLLQDRAFAYMGT